MSKRIEEVLNLPSMADDFDEEVSQMISNFESKDITDMLIDPDGVKQHEEEMDEIYKLAMVAHKDAIDLAFNMEPKNAAAVINSAATMLDIAYKTSKSKTESKMNSIKLKMEQEKHAKEVSKEEEGIIEGDAPLQGAYMASRNALLAKAKT